MFIYNLFLIIREDISIHWQLKCKTPINGFPETILISHWHIKRVEMKLGNRLGICFHQIRCCDCFPFSSFHCEHIWPSAYINRRCLSISKWIPWGWDGPYIRMFALLQTTNKPFIRNRVLGSSPQPLSVYKSHNYMDRYTAKKPQKYVNIQNLSYLKLVLGRSKQTQTVYMTLEGNKYYTLGMNNYVDWIWLIGQNTWWMLWLRVC